MIFYLKLELKDVIFDIISNMEIVVYTKVKEGRKCQKHRGLGAGFEGRVEVKWVWGQEESEGLNR